MALRKRRIGVEPPGLVWVKCPHPVPALEAQRATEGRFRVHHETEPPAGERPYCVVLCRGWQDGAADLAAEVRRARDRASGAPVLVLGPRPDPRLATAALRAGAGGFMHAGMRPADLPLALSLVGEGRIVIPQEIVLDLLGENLFLSMPAILGSGG